MNYYNLSPGECLNELKSDKDKGLSKKQAVKRQSEYGENKLAEKKGVNPFMLFLNQFRSFIIYILIFATVISFIAGEVAEAILILVILIFNAVFGFFQEYRAEKSIAALSKISASSSRVIRDSVIDVVPVSELVPGDIILLEEGDKVPADCRLLESIGLFIIEAALTGESKAVLKEPKMLKGNLAIADRTNYLYSSTIVTSGKATAVVCSIGMDTEIGKIADLLSCTETGMTPLQKKLDVFGKYVGFGIIGICFVVFFMTVYQSGNLNLLFSGQFSEFVIASQDSFLIAIALAVAAVPSGLPAIVTIALAIGVKKMVSQNALMRKLACVETLGGTNIICTDKTGTLTENKMTVRNAWTINNESEVTGTGYSPNGTVDKSVASMLFEIGVNASESTILKKDGHWTVTGDPTEGALVVSSKKYGINFSSLRKEWNRVDEVPFDSKRKLMSVVRENVNGKEKLVFTKGAPENVLGICNRILDNGKVRKLTSDDKKKILAQNILYADDALRVLGFAYKKFDSKGIEKDLVFVGLQAMMDQPHKEVKESISRCHTAGIRVIMITGDNLNTAQGIAKKIGIDGDGMLGTDFEKLSDFKKREVLKTTNIFARVAPEHKMEIVTILQKQGKVVAMTGDGVNDAPAIKKADIGVAMGINGTDVSKEASDMVLLDDKFTTIVKAVEEGRGIYENIKKFINYLFSSNLAEVFVVLFAIILNMPLPMTAVMLVWLNLVTDGLPALALSVDPYSKTLMDSKPKKSSESIMDKAMAFNVVYVAILICVAILGLVQYGLSLGFEVIKLQTMAFTAIVMMEMVRIYSIRSEFGLGLFSNMYLFWAIVSSIGLHLLVLYVPIIAQLFKVVPLASFDWFLIFVATSLVFVLNYVGINIRKKFGWFDN
jgi:Ca2+-transporting ATPase